MAQKLRPVIRFNERSSYYEIVTTRLDRPITLKSLLPCARFYCPICDKRLSAQVANPTYYGASKRCRNGEPSYCKYCGSLIYPIEI